METSSAADYCASDSSEEEDCDSDDSDLNQATANVMATQWTADNARDYLVQQAGGSLHVDLAGSTKNKCKSVMQNWDAFCSVTDQIGQPLFLTATDSKDIDWNNLEHI